MRRLLRLPLRSASRARAEADEELDSLLESRVDDLVARGMAPVAARAAALRRLGESIEKLRERLHHSAALREQRMTRTEQVQSFVQDAQYAARGLARTPGFTAVAVVTLAIGIGATTAIFSAVNALILRPLPFRDPQRLMSVTLTAPAMGSAPANDAMVWSYPKFMIFKEGQTAFESLALYASTQIATTSGEAEQLRGEWVGARYFTTLGIAPAVGRGFDPAVDAPVGGRREVVITDALWQRRFAADPGVIGRTIDLSEPYTIVGVTAPGFSGLTGQAEIFLSMTARTEQDMGSPFAHQFNLVARRRADVTVERARNELAVLGARIDRAFPGFGKGGTVGWGATARPLDDTRLAPLVRRSLLVLAGAVILVLLIAAVNLANLLLGRASARRREIAIRLALGAGRGRLVRLLLTESLVLALLGAVASTLVAWWGTRALRGVNPATLAAGTREATTSAVGLSAIHLDTTAFAFLLGVALVVGALFGLAPALGSTRGSLTGALSTGRDDAVTFRRGLLSGRRLLVVLEVALATILLAGSGLMIRSLAKLLAVDPGFDPRHVLTMRVTIPPGALARDSQPTFYTQLVERLGALPGVESVGLNSCAPMGGGYCNFTKIDIRDDVPIDPSLVPGIGVHWATPGYFAAMRVPLRRGRLFSGADRLGAPKVVLMSEAAATRYWPNVDPIGKHVGVYQGGFADGAEVIGIVGDVRMEPDSAPKPDTYLPFSQSPQSSMIVYIRASKAPASLAGPARRVVHDLAPAYPVHDMQTMDARVATATAQPRFSAALLGLFAAVALALAGVGIYGVMSYLVGRRAREIGIRMALGADASAVMRMVVGEGLALAGAGAVLGLGGALPFTRVLRTLLFDVTPSDPATYATIVVLAGAAAAAACWLPARRATRVDPLLSLRAD